MTAFNRLPTTIAVEGLEIPINTDFRASIAFEDSIQHIADDPDSAIEEILRHYFDESAMAQIARWVQAGLANAFIAAVMDFYGPDNGQKSSAHPRKQRPLYAFSHDSQRIYAAFWQHYRIDLYTVDYLHWHKFRALFSALPEDCEISRIMRIRGAEMHKDMTAKERASLRKAQAAYALPDLRSKEEMEADFVGGFAGMF